MENASKALIIAGAILLSILIITLGLGVYNQGKNATGSANLDAQEISAHNSKFLAYEGRQKGSQVKSLLNAIRSNNKEYADRMIKINFNLGTTSKGSIESYDAKTSADSNEYSKISNVKSSTTYFVTFVNGDNGCIAGVEIHIYSDADL